jgi:hypothetical protein
MVLLDGKKTANDIKDEITISVNEMIDLGEKVPHLAAVLVGSDGASLTYVGSKVRACERVGFNSTLIELPETTSEEELLKVIQDLNGNNDIDGFIVQLPLIFKLIWFSLFLPPIFTVVKIKNRIRRFFPLGGWRQLRKKLNQILHQHSFW